MPSVSTNKSARSCHCLTYDSPINSSSSYSSDGQEEDHQLNSVNLSSSKNCTRISAFVSSEVCRAQSNKSIRSEAEFKREPSLIELQIEDDRDDDHNLYYTKDSPIPDHFIAAITRAFSTRSNRTVDLHRDVLQVERNASESELRTAYFRHGRQVLSGRFTKALEEQRNDDTTSKFQSSKRQFHAISMAYEILTTPKLRHFYNEYGLVSSAPTYSDPKLEYTSFNHTIARTENKPRSVMQRGRTSEQVSHVHNTKALLMNPKSRSLSRDRRWSNLTEIREQSSRSASRSIRWNDQVEELVYEKEHDEFDKMRYKTRSPSPQTTSTCMMMEDCPLSSYPGKLRKVKRKVILEAQALVKEIENMQEACSGDGKKRSFLSHLLDDLEASLDGLETRVESFWSFAKRKGRKPDDSSKKVSPDPFSDLIDNETEATDAFADIEGKVNNDCSVSAVETSTGSVYTPEFTTEEPFEIVEDIVSEKETETVHAFALAENDCIVLQSDPLSPNTTVGLDLEPTLKADSIEPIVEKKCLKSGTSTVPSSFINHTFNCADEDKADAECRYRPSICEQIHVISSPKEDLSSRQEKVVSPTGSSTRKKSQSREKSSSRGRSTSRTRSSSRSRSASRIRSASWMARMKRSSRKSHSVNEADDVDQTLLKCLISASSSADQIDCQIIVPDDIPHLSNDVSKHSSSSCGEEGTLLFSNPKTGFSDRTHISFVHPVPHAQSIFDRKQGKKLEIFDPFRLHDKSTKPRHIINESSSRTTESNGTIGIMSCSEDATVSHQIEAEGCSDRQSTTCEESSEDSTKEFLLSNKIRLEFRLNEEPSLVQRFDQGTSHFSLSNMSFDPSPVTLNVMEGSGLPYLADTSQFTFDQKQAWPPVTECTNDTQSLSDTSHSTFDQKKTRPTVFTNDTKPRTCDPIMGQVCRSKSNDDEDVTNSIMICMQAYTEFVDSVGLSIANLMVATVVVPEHDVQGVLNILSQEMDNAAHVLAKS